MTNNFNMPKSPFTQQQTEDMRKLRDEIIPWMEQQLKDAELAGVDTTEIKQLFENSKAQLAKLVQVYGNKYN